MEALDVEVFRSWLEAHAGEEVGETMDVIACPLARWLSEVHGCRWYASGYHYGDCEGNELYSIPVWASRFVKALDRRYGSSWRVMGAQALAVLDEIVPR